MEITTCQICARAIKAKRGLIAHHGYQRPHQGWQTRSCPGARQRPYEVACDAIAPVIEQLERQRNQHAHEASILLHEPPPTLTHTRRDARGKVVRESTYERPAGFDPQVAQYGPYNAEFRARLNLHLRQADALGRDIDALRRRLAAWTAPAG